MEIILLNITGLVPLIVMAFKTFQKLLFYIGFITWLVPPFRQYKGGFFLYFLVLALTEPLGMLMYYLFSLNPMYLYAPSSLCLLLTSLYYLHSIKFNILLVNLAFFLLSIFLFIEYGNIRILIFLMAILQIEIFCGFIISLVRKLVNRNIFYTYFLLIIFYEFSLIVKSISYVFDIKTSMPFIHMLGILEVIIGLYFILFNLKNSPKIYPKPIK